MNNYEKIIFGGAISLNYLFYGILNIALLLGLPNSMISGGLRLSMFLAAILLVIWDWYRRQYGRLTVPVIAFICFTLYYTAVFILEPARNFLMSMDYISMSGGKPYAAYMLFIVGWGSFLLFFCGRDRFMFLIARPSLVYLPALLGTLFILWVNRGAFSGFSLTSAGNEFANRSIVKASMGALFSISLYYLIFGKVMWQRVLLGLPGLGISGINLLISDSKSAILSFAAIAFVYLLLSLRHAKTAMFTIVFYAVVAIFLLPFLFMSNAWTRLITLAEGYQEMYLAGNDELGRWDMIVEGWSRFISNPFFGDGIYAEWGGSSTHFLPLEILVPTGIIGGVFFSIAAYGMLRGALYLMRVHPISYWILGLVTWEFSQQLFHGYTSAIFCLSTGILLCADCIRQMPRRLPAAPLIRLPVNPYLSKSPRIQRQLLRS